MQRRAPEAQLRALRAFATMKRRARRLCLHIHCQLFMFRDIAIASFVGVHAGVASQRRRLGVLCSWQVFVVVSQPAMGWARACIVVAQGDYEGPCLPLVWMTEFDVDDKQQWGRRCGACWPCARGGRFLFLYLVCMWRARLTHVMRGPCRGRSKRARSWRFKGAWRTATVVRFCCFLVSILFIRGSWRPCERGGWRCRSDVRWHGEMPRRSQRSARV